MQRFWLCMTFFFFFQAEDGIRDYKVTGVQTCALPILRELGVGEIAALVGRYYAMDRDNRWERVELAYRALVHGQAETRTDDAVAALERSYEAGLTDEFVRPIVETKGSAASAVPVGLIRDDDAVTFFNFRADRARQMTYAQAAPDHDKFVDAQRPK